MNSFSIASYEHQQIIETYKQWLVRDLYQNLYIDNINDPNFLKKLSVIQAEGIRHDIAIHAAVTHNSIQTASDIMVKKLQTTAALITSSLDEGFTMMNQRMFELNDTLHIVNSNIVEGNKLQARNIQEIQALNKNMVIALSAINTNISQSTHILKSQIQQVTHVLKAILDELRIPESQRERRYHIEEGVKFFNMGIKTGDSLYFEDSLDEFNIAVSIEKKDFFSWYYIGMIHLYSKDHLDIEKAISSFDRYFHYAAALPKKHELYDDAVMLKAECYYLKQDLSGAFKLVSELASSNVRAILRGVKYLSATGVADKQLKAVEVFKELMEKSPYIVMQVIEDYDIINNDYIIAYLKEYNSNTRNYILGIMALFDREMESFKRFPISYYQDLNDEIDALKKRVNKRINSIEVIDAIVLKEELQNMGMRTKIKSVLETAQKKADEEAEQRRRMEEYNVSKEKYRKEREHLKSHGYVDMGLPSGRLWKAENEREFYSISSAKRTFGSEYITGEGGWEELIKYCKWSWEWSIFRRSGYRITGPNGLSIFLPADGVMCGNGQVLFANQSGNYLSCSTCEDWPSDDDDYYGGKDTYLRCFHFSKNYKHISNNALNSLYSLRLSFWKNYH